MAVSTSARRAGCVFAQNVSGVPLPYLHEVAEGEGPVLGVAVGEGEGRAAVGVGLGPGAVGEDEPEQESAVATATARTLERIVCGLVIH